MPYPIDPQIDEWLRLEVISPDEVGRLMFEGAQSERVGPSPFSPLWEDQNFDLARDTATAATARSHQVGTYQWYHLDNYARYVSGQTQPRQPESASQAQGGQMKISTIPDPLTPSEQRNMKNFFREVLTNGHAAWPIDRSRYGIHIDGTLRRIYPDSYWALTEEYLCIGRSRDAGSGVMENPSNRLACIVALMGIFEMQNDPELISLVEKRLARILAGVYENAITPLAQRSNKEPIAKIAWSSTGGVAAWVDGKWASPITGEEVILKADEGWVVVETGEGRTAGRDREAEFQGITYSAEHPAPSGGRTILRQDFDRWVSRHNFIVTQTTDGRPAVCFGSSNREYVQEIYLPEAIREGGPNVEVIQNTDGSWGIAPSRASVPTLAEANQQLRRAIDGAGNIGMGVFLPDGRQSWACSSEEDAQFYLRLYQEASPIPHAVIEDIDRNDWYVVSMPVHFLPSSF